MCLPEGNVCGAESSWLTPRHILCWRRIRLVGRRNLCPFSREWYLANSLHRRISLYCTGEVRIAGTLLSVELTLRHDQL